LALTEDRPYNTQETSDDLRRERERESNRALAETRRGNDEDSDTIEFFYSGKNIRDLRQHHLSLLSEINTRVRAWLRETQQGCFGMYFHFLPSVFQLHLHVRDKSFSRKHVRMQPLQNVMGNLAKTSMYYKDALIMTKYCKMFQKAETHRKMDINI